MQATDGSVPARQERMVGVAMTIGTQRDAVPDAVSLLYSEDVVHIQEPRIVLRLPAASSLTAARQALRGVPADRV